MAFFSLFLLKRAQLLQTLAKLLNTRLIANRVCEMRRITLRWYFRMEELNSARKWQIFNILRLTFQVRQFLTHLRLVSFSEKDPLLRQLYEFDEQVEDLSQGVRPMSRALWKNRHHVTVTELSSSFQREVLSGGGKEFKVLDAFLKQVTSTYCCKGLGFCATKIFLVILTPFSAYISGSVSFLSLSLHAFPFKQNNTGTQVALRSVSARCCSPPASIDEQIPPKNWQNRCWELYRPWISQGGT